jgi:hypothetical protein
VASFFVCGAITKMAAAAATTQEDDVGDVLPEVQEFLLDEIELLIQASFELSERLTQVQERLMQINVSKILGGVPTMS